MRLAIYGLTLRELRGNVEEPRFLDLLSGGDVDALAVADPPPDLPAYLELALTGGFPELVLRLTGPARTAWLDSYLDQLLTRDAALLTGRAPPCNCAATSRRWH